MIQSSPQSRRIALEELEPRCLLAASVFSSQALATEYVHEPNTLNVADIDGDGHVDILAAGDGGQISLLRNVGGDGTFNQHSESPIEAAYSTSIYAADVDGDGHLDVLTSSPDTNNAVWYRNTDGQGTFGRPMVISGESDASQIRSADIDGDGHADAVTARQHAITWNENIDGRGTFGGEKVIARLPKKTWGVSVHVADIDGDGDVDVVAGTTHSLVWYENINGRGEFGPENVLLIEPGRLPPMDVVDMDADGDLDVISVFYRDESREHWIVWHENTDGQGSFRAERKIATCQGCAPYSVTAADLDGDGDIDVLAALEGSLSWFESNGNEQIMFEERLLVPSYASRFMVAVASDVDGDGSIDVVSASRGKNLASGNVAWYRSMDGRGVFAQPIVITPEFREPFSVFGADVDTDGDIDVIAASPRENKIVWFENMDGQGTFGKQKVITDRAIGVRSAIAADVDHDGDVDVISSAGLVWLENTNGRGAFGRPRMITDQLIDAISLFSGDVDGDGDVDVLAGIRQSRENTTARISWFKNSNGTGMFGESVSAMTSEKHLTSVNAADMDGDGDLDVIVSSYGDECLSWFENTDGLGHLKQFQIHSGGCLSRTAVPADMDGDGDLDVLSADLDNESSFYWLENTDSLGNFGSPIVIADDLGPVWAIAAIDMDNDGDIDVLSGNSNRNEIGNVIGSVLWFENLDGQANLGSKNTVSASDAWTFSIFAADMDGDSDIDVVTADPLFSTVAWHEQHIMGDSNGDGQFDRQDILHVLQAGKYLSGENAVFEQGDWNFDGKFDRTDIIAALQLGNYAN